MNKLTAKDFKRGIRVVKSQLTDFDNYPVYQNSLKPLGFYSKYNVKANTVFVICAGAAGDIGFSNKNFWAADDCYYLETDKYVDSKFIYYYLLSIQNDIKRQVRQASVPRLGSNVLKSIILPSVSDNKQQEIVKILDSFTNLIDALNKELSLRQKQFEYYREKLLTFDDNTNRYCLKEVFETKNGYTPSTSNKEYWDNGNIPWFRMEDIRQNGRILNDSTLHITRAGVKGNRLFKANSIILATSATIGEHALILVEHLSNQRFTNFYPNEAFDKKVNMKYIYYYMFIIDEWCKSHVNQGGFASVDMDGLFKLSIPIPSLAIQQSIVEKLDAFESLISSLKEEIVLRQKQYEYYREKLLTFD